MKRPMMLVLFFAVPLLVFATWAPLVVIAQGEFPAADGQALLDYVLRQNSYTNWGTWPDPNSQGFLQSGAPHGGVVRIFVNDVALSAANNFTGQLPANSIIVKENYTGSDPASPGDLGALTVMYKVPGFAPETNDWFWLKAAGDGSAIDLQGAVAGCIGCHGGVEGNKDYILRFGFGGPAAVTSARDLAAAPAPAAQATPATLPTTGGEPGIPTTTVFLGLLALAGAVLIVIGVWLRRHGPLSR